MTTPALPQRRSTLSAQVATAKRSIRESMASLVEVVETVATGSEHHRFRVALRLWESRKVEG